MTTSSATLNGTVDPNGRATVWYFEYGTSTSYGSKTAEHSAGSGGSAVPVTIGVSGLARGRVYHYRLVATSDAGTSRGADQTFSTVGAPSVTTDAASSVAPTSARLNGRVTPNGAATSWYFEYGTTTRYGSRTPTKNAGSGTNAAKVSFSLTGLRRTTTYHYRLVAANGSGTTAGGDRSFSTSLAPAVRTGAAQSVGDDDGDADRHDRPARPCDDLVVRVRHDDALRLDRRRRGAPARASSRGRSRRRSPASRQGRRTTSGSSRRATPARPTAATQRSRPSASRSSRLRSTSSTGAGSCSAASCRRGGAERTSRCLRSRSARARSARSSRSSPQPTGAGAISRSPGSRRRTRRAGTTARARSRSSPCGPRSRSAERPPDASRRASPERGRSPGGSCSCSGAPRPDAG